MKTIPEIGKTYKFKEGTPFKVAKISEDFVTLELGSRIPLVHFEKHAVEVKDEPMQYENRSITGNKEGYEHEQKIEVGQVWKNYRREVIIQTIEKDNVYSKRGEIMSKGYLLKNYTLKSDAPKPMKEFTTNEVSSLFDQDIYERTGLKIPLNKPSSPLEDKLSRFISDLEREIKECQTESAKLNSRAANLAHWKLKLEREVIK